MNTPKIDFFLGTVREVKDRVTYEITADIPGVAEEITAYPYSRGEMDEPVEGNLIYLLSLDPIYHSVFLYTKAKENDFIGIRSNGKTIDITPDYITVGVYDTDKKNKDNERPDLSKSYIKMDSEGNIEVMASGNETITIKGSSTVNITGDANITIEGSMNAEVKGSCTIDSPDVKITGGKLTTNGTVAPNKGPYCALPVCVFSGCNHSGNEVSGT